MRFTPSEGNFTFLHLQGPLRACCGLLRPFRRYINVSSMIFAGTVVSLFEGEVHGADRCAAVGANRQEYIILT